MFLKWLKHSKKMDIFSKPVELTINRVKGHRTFFGAFLTFSIIGVIAYVFVLELLALFTRSDLNYLTLERTNTNPGPYYLGKNNFTLQFGLNDKNQVSYIDDSVYSIKAYLVKQKRASKVELSREELPLANCSQTERALKDYFDIFSPAQKLCFDWANINQLSIAGTAESEERQAIIITIKTCQNRTDSMNCKSPEHINAVLDKNYLNFELLSNDIDLKVFDNPYTTMGQSFYTSVSQQIMKELTLSFQSVITETDAGLVGKETGVQKALKFKDFQEMTNYDPSDDVAQIVIALSDKEHVNTRRYRKFQDILAQIGGLWNAFYTVAFLIQYIYSEFSYNLLIINKLFNFETPCSSQPNPGPIEVAQKKAEKPEGPMNQKTQKKTFMLERLQSISFREKQLNADDSNPQEKQHIIKQLNRSISRYMRVIHQKLTLSTSEYVSLLCCSKVKLKQYHYSVNRMDKVLDILYIINKLQEVDKLKMILMNKQQLQLFDFLPKPTIPIDLKNQPTAETTYCSLLRETKSRAQKALEAKDAYWSIINKLDDPINRHLLSSLDNEFVELLKQPKQSDYQIQFNNDEQVAVPVIPINSLEMQELNREARTN